MAPENSRCWKELATVFGANIHYKVAARIRLGVVVWVNCLQSEDWTKEILRVKRLKLYFE